MSTPKLIQTAIFAYVFFTGGQVIGIAATAAKEPAAKTEEKVVLEQRVLVIARDYPLDSRKIKLPPNGECVLLDKQQAELLCNANDNSHAGAAETLPTLALRDGENWRDSNPSGQNYYELCPRVSADRHIVNLQVTF